MSNILWKTLKEKKKENDLSKIYETVKKIKQMKVT